MMKSLDLKGKTKDDIREFIFKLSPYSDIRLSKFQKLFDDFLSDETYQHMEVLGEATKDSVKYFLVWRNFNNTKVFAGTAFIPNTEVQRGVHLKQYEVNI